MKTKAIIFTLLIILPACSEKNPDSYTENLKQAVKERKPIVDTARSQEPQITGYKSPEEAVRVALNDILNNKKESAAILNKEEFINEYWPRLENRRVYDPGLTPEFLWNLKEKSRVKAANRLRERVQRPFTVVSVQYKEPVVRYGLKEFEIEKIIVASGGNQIIITEFFTFIEVNGKYKISGYGV